MRKTWVDLLREDLAEVGETFADITASTKSAGYLETMPTDCWDEDREPDPVYVWTKRFVRATGFHPELDHALVHRLPVNPGDFKAIYDPTAFHNIAAAPVNPNVMLPGAEYPDYLTEAQRAAMDRLRARHDDIEFPHLMLFCDGAITTHSDSAHLSYAIEKDGYTHT